MRRFISVILVVALVATAVGFFGCAKKVEEMKIGAVLPLTGSAGIWGENAKMGMEIALEEVNNEGGINGRPVKIIYEDSQSEPSMAVSSLRKLIATHEVQAVIGDIASSNVLAMAPVAQAERTVLLSPGASNPDISKAGEYIFRNWQSDALEGEVDAKFAYEDMKYKRMAILYVNNAYGTGLMTVFEHHFKKMGGEITAIESFEQGATDMRTQLQKIQKARPESIYMPGYPPEMMIVLKQARELRIEIPFLSVQAFDDPKILEVAGDAAEGVVFSVPKPPDPAEEVVRKFQVKYKKKYNRDPGVCSDTGYDALKIIVWAMRKGALSADQIRQQLLMLKDFPGTAGLTTFDENGDVIRPFVFKKVENGKFVTLQEAR